MSSTPKRSPVQKPVAILIAAQMRVPAGGVKPNKPVNVGKALRKAMNSSPQAKAAFKQNKGAVNQAKPHLQALANRQGQGLMSSLKHGVSAMRSLKQVTRDMAKQPGANTLKVESNVPLNAKAQKHMDGITKAMEGPKPSLFSALGQGIGLMRELRKTTRQMKQESMRAPHQDATPSHGDARALSPMPQKSGDAGKPGDKSSTRPSTRPFAETADLLRSLGQGVRMMHGLKQVTRAMKSADNRNTQTDTPTGTSMSAQGMPTSRRNGDSPLAVMLIARRSGPTGGQGPGKHGLGMHGLGVTAPIDPGSDQD